MNETQIKEFLKTVEEKYNKLSKEARNQFWEGTEGKFDKVTIPEAYELSKEWFDYENKLKEEQKMENKEKSTNAEIVEKGGVPKDLEVVKKKIVERNELVYGMTFQECQVLSNEIYKARQFPSIQNPSQALSKILAGREYGIPPMISLATVYIVNGKTAVETKIAMALVKKSKDYDYRIMRQDSMGASVQFLFQGKPINDNLKGISTFEEKDARLAGLLDKSGSMYKKYPKLMYVYRAFIFGARIYCPHIINNLYSYEVEGQELGFNVDSDLSNFKVEPIEVNKSLPVETKPEPTRKEIMAPLVEKHGMKRVKEVIAKCKIEGSVFDATDEKFKEVIDTLNTLGKVSDKFKKEKESEKKETEMTIDEKRKEIKKLKKDFGEDKIKEIKHTMKIEGKLVELNEKTFKKFVKRVKSK
jgi:hypothetical protein